MEGRGGDKMKGDDGRGEGGMVTLPFTQLSRHFTNHVISHMSSHMSSHMIRHMTRHMTST